ncbi:MAG: 23S rRNA pseudouridine synthase [Gammaproteobacteria bacterium]|nr:MAG: 23S rRNA pseudouridine synthase [Gammaproteobacteria bacterium]TND02635.1 MAG: 23S rRNA pseudouridine synthase [Gammaproteobacteria bacterium]
MAGLRLDQALAGLFPDYSRSRLKQWIVDGQVTVNGRSLRPKDKLRGGEAIEIAATLVEQTAWTGENIALDIVYEDDDVIVINKPAGLVVHPAAGNQAGTLVNALLHHAPELNALPRAGIVHRLDKNTSGLLIVARTLSAHKHLVDQLQARLCKREYQAVVNGVMIAGGRVDAPLARHPLNRKRMAVVDEGREAISHFRVIERFRAHTLASVQLETGRTHQIRVHMAHIQFPIVGDPEYGGRLHMPKGATEALRDALHGFKRQALHAVRLTVTHPRLGTPMEWSAPLPPDMVALIAVLRADVASDKAK